MTAQSARCADWIEWNRINDTRITVDEFGHKLHKPQLLPHSQKASKKNSKTNSQCYFRSSLPLSVNIIKEPFPPTGTPLVTLVFLPSNY